MIENLKRILFTYREAVIIVLTTLISISAFVWYFNHDLQYFGLLDGIPRLNFARKVVDNLTPGIGQLGSVWLPFPHLLAVPFIGNDFMWHSGLAGSLISMLSFVIGGLFLFKLVYLFTKNTGAAVLGWLLYVTNINMLFFQSSQMSEPLYVTCIICIVYYLSAWHLYQRIGSLLKAATWIVIITLTRYEGYFVLLAAVLFVVIRSYIEQRRTGRKGQAEGVSIMFVTLSFLGVFLWTVYLTAIFHQPFFWLAAYTQGQNTVLNKEGLTKNKQFDETTTAQPAKTAAKSPLLYTAQKYSFAMMTASGVITFFVAIAGFMYGIYDIIRRRDRSPWIVPLLFLGFITIFMIVGLYKAFIPGLEMQPISLQNFLDKSLSLTSTVNIRYGLAALPFLALAFAYVFSRNRILPFIGFNILLVQLFLNSQTNLSLYYELPRQFKYTPNTEAELFKRTYDGGLILISDHAHQYFIFDTGIPYKNFIHEGTQKYWISSLKNPITYAKYVILDENNNDDTVRDYLQNRELLEKAYSLEYTKGGFKVYKIKDER